MKKSAILFLIAGIILSFSAGFVSAVNNDTNAPCGRGNDGNACVCVSQPDIDSNGCTFYLPVYKNGCIVNYNKTCPKKNSEGFCGTSTNYACTSSSDCQVGGCSGQVCAGKNEGGITTTCEYKDCYNKNKYNLECVCADKKCQWREISSTQQCQKDEDCIELACPNGGFAHQKCVNSECKWLTSCENEDNETEIKPNISVKIMPDTASSIAIARLRLKVCNESNNCTIVLKDTGLRNADNKKTYTYEVQAERHYKILGLFKAKALVKAEINADTGEVISAKKPWWAFLASEPEE